MNWFVRNQNKISLFIAGWCAASALDCFARGDWTWAAINAFLSFVNIKLAND